MWQYWPKKFKTSGARPLVKWLWIYVSKIFRFLKNKIHEIELISFNESFWPQVFEFLWPAVNWNEELFFIIVPPQNKLGFLQRFFFWFCSSCNFVLLFTFLPLLNFFTCNYYISKIPKPQKWPASLFLCFTFWLETSQLSSLVDTVLQNV